MAYPKSDIPIEQRRRDYYERNKARLTLYKAKHYRDNRDVWHASKLKKYGLTLEQYNAMAEAQGNACKICHTEDWATRDGRLHVDHDHATGEVRGLLCHHCNVGLGHFQDRTDLLEVAIRYLDRRM